MTNPHVHAERIVNEVHYAERLVEYGVPEHLRAGLIRYLVQRIRPGGFLVAVLKNDLAETLRRADPVSFAGLPSIRLFLDNEAPSPSWGSPAAFQAWLDGAAQEGSR